MLGRVLVERSKFEGFCLRIKDLGKAWVVGAHSLIVSLGGLCSSGSTLCRGYARLGLINKSRTIVNLADGSDSGAKNISHVAFDSVGTPKAILAISKLSFNGRAGLKSKAMGEVTFGDHNKGTLILG